MPPFQEFPFQAFGSVVASENIIATTGKEAFTMYAYIATIQLIRTLLEEDTIKPQLLKLKSHTYIYKG